MDLGVSLGDDTCLGLCYALTYVLNRVLRILVLPTMVMVIRHWVVPTLFASLK